MPVIRVSDEVMEILKKFAIPLEDTPDSVLRRILNEYVKIQNGKKGGGGKNAKLSTLQRKGALIGRSKQRYAQWIVAILESQEGRARSRELMVDIEKIFGKEFSEEEREPLKSGKPRWVKNVNSARGEMVKQGLLKKTKYGIWELA